MVLVVMDGESLKRETEQRWNRQMRENGIEGRDSRQSLQSENAPAAALACGLELRIVQMYA